MSSLEDAMLTQVLIAGLPEPEREYLVVPGRRFRGDLVWPKEGIAMELEGGVFSGGRHTTGVGYTRDCEKHSRMSIQGWTLIRATAPMVRSGLALDLLRAAFERVLEGAR